MTQKNDRAPQARDHFFSSANTLNPREIFQNKQHKKNRCKAVFYLYRIGVICLFAVDNWP